MEGTFPDRSESLIQDLDAGGSRFGPSANFGNQASALDRRIGSAPTGWPRIFGDQWCSAAVSHGTGPTIDAETGFAATVPVVSAA